jgi:hypothetical protein
MLPCHCTQHVALPLHPASCPATCSVLLLPIPQEAAALVTSWLEQQQSFLGKALAFVTSKQLNMQFHDVLGQLRAAFNNLGVVMSVEAAMWPDTSAQEASRQDMAAVLAQLKGQGQEARQAHAEVKVRA